MKSGNEWSLIECVNVWYNAEVKELIREEVMTSDNPSLQFAF